MYTSPLSPAALPRASLAYRLVQRLLAFESEARTRARLAQLDPHMLCDIGLTADEAQALSQRPEWDAPAHWHR